MSLRWKLVIVAVLVGMAAIYGEFVLDIRAPRSKLAQISALGTNIFLETAALGQASEEMKKKFGADAKTVLETKPPRIITRIGDKIVNQFPAPYSFASAIGLFIVGPPGKLESIFPFRLDPNKMPKAPPSAAREVPTSR